MNRLLSRVKLAYQIAVIGAIGIIGLVAIGIVYLFVVVILPSLALIVAAFAVPSGEVTAAASSCRLTAPSRS